MTKSRLVLLWAFVSVASIACQANSAEVPADVEAEHQQLRELREKLTQAVIDGDIETQLAYAHDDIVTTWQNSQVARGKDGVRKLLEEMNGTGERVFQGYKVPPTPDDLTILHGGDTAIAFGSSVPHYKYAGMEFDLNNRWTATLVKEDGQWKLAAYHVSANVLDNSILRLARRSLYWVGGGCLFVGAILGLALAYFARRKSA
jgi:ketosteroid isomerase-like protein